VPAVSDIRGCRLLLSVRRLLSTSGDSAIIVAAHYAKLRQTAKTTCRADTIYIAATHRPHSWCITIEIVHVAQQRRLVNAGTSPHTTAIVTTSAIEVAATTAIVIVGIDVAIAVIAIIDVVAAQSIAAKPAAVARPAPSPGIGRDRLISRLLSKSDRRRARS
jgi:hypothetical protein